MGDDGNAVYRPEPDIAIISDTRQGRARGEAVVRAAGGRIALTADLSAACARLDSHIGLDALLLLLSQAPGDAARALSGWMERAIGAHRTVIAIPFDMVDTVHARLARPDVEIQCDPTDAELVGALGLATIRRAPALHQPGGGDDVNLLRLSEEVGRIARALAELSQGESGLTKGRMSLGEAPFAFRAEPPPTSTVDADSIRRVIRMRRLRDRFFDAGLFADPAWDMLLDLMAARLEGRNVAVSSLCIAAAVPPTTALRWIKTMTEAGIFERHADPEDGRRIFIALSDAAASAVEAWFAAVRREGGSAAV